MGSPSPARAPGTIDAAAPAPALDPDRLPRPFGKLQLVDRIGQGGMAEIFLARSPTGLGGERLVVVKQILASLSSGPEFARMFIEEAKLCAGLRHANVVQVFDLGREEGRLFLVMEYVEGFDLHRLLSLCSKSKVPLPPEFALFLVREVVAALDFAHRATDADGRALGIVHRDVSPSNVLMSFEGEVKLCDFGIARAAGLGAADEARATGSSPGAAPRVVGKSAYMAPEHARGEDVDARADVFAAGILLWELCAGRRMRRGTEEAMLEQAKHPDIPALPERGLPAHASLQALVSRALAPDRDARFGSAAEFLRALDAYAHEASMVASPLRFGAFLTDHFGETFLAERRARERAARALALGPAVQITALEGTGRDDAPSDVAVVPGDAHDGDRAAAVARPAVRRALGKALACAAALAALWALLGR